MAAKLKKYFPMIREREELLAEIAANRTLREIFAGWEKEQQETFLDICTGVKGLKFLLWRCKRSVICFPDRDAHAIQQTCY